MEFDYINLNISEILGNTDYDNIILKRRNNRMLLSDYQIDVLSRNGIFYERYTNIRDLLFDIEELLNNDYDDELDIVSSQISEFIYYTDTKK